MLKDVCIPSSFCERVPLYLILEPILILTTGKPKVMPAVSEYVLNFLVPGLGATLTPTTVLAHIFLSFIVNIFIHGNGRFPFCSDKLGYAFRRKFASFC